MQCLKKWQVRTISFLVAQRWGAGLSPQALAEGPRRRAMAPSASGYAAA